jgi:hypothetical protein
MRAFEYLTVFSIEGLTVCTELGEVGLPDREQSAIDIDTDLTGHPVDHEEKVAKFLGEVFADELVIAVSRGMVGFDECFDFSAEFFTLLTDKVHAKLEADRIIPALHSGLTEHLHEFINHLDRGHSGTTVVITHC